ncbi:MAG: hypothetical protein H5T69_14485 [Chloroflexi bacterium]|nr:hypothetical protein [Chloroflexota bacterium]
MEKQRLVIGSRTILRSGHVQDNLRPVEFEGELLASHTDFSGDDTRGITESLYRTLDGRLVVYVEDWSRWQGEPTIYRLVAVEDDDFEPGGRFELLGRQAGLVGPLSLDQALNG